MAVHGSVIKRARQNTKARQRNRSWKSRIKTQQKRIEGTFAQKETNTLADLYREYCSLVDKAASRKILHKNNASRKKTKMHLRIQDAMSPSPPSLEGELSKKSPPSKKGAPSKKSASSKKSPSTKKTSSTKEAPSSKTDPSPKGDEASKGDEAPIETESLKGDPSPKGDPPS